MLAHSRQAAAAFYDASRQGTLAYVSGNAAPEQPRSLAWVDRRGSEQRVNAPVRPYAAARLSPDGTRVALAIRDQERDIWIWDFARETLRKLTHGPATAESPEWTPDGRHLVFASNRSGSMNLYMQAADGSGPVRRLTSSHTAQWPTAVTHDSILGHEFGAATSFDLFLFRFDKAAGPSSGATPPGVDGQVRPLVRDAVTQTQATLSPDGRYVAYQSNESGPFEIYVRPFPEVGRAQWQVSAAGGTRPVWAGNGELFYVDASGALLAVRVSTDGPTLTWDNPAKIHDVGSDHPLLNFRAYDVAPDGRRILTLRNEPGSGSGAESPHVTVVINWAGELEATVPAGR